MPHAPSPSTFHHTGGGSWHCDKFPPYLPAVPATTLPCGVCKREREGRSEGGKEGEREGGGEGEREGGGKGERREREREGGRGKGLHLCRQQHCTCVVCVRETERKGEREREGAGRGRGGLHPPERASICAAENIALWCV